MLGLIKVGLQGYWSSEEQETKIEKKIDLPTSMVTLLLLFLRKYSRNCPTQLNAKSLKARVGP